VIRAYNETLTIVENILDRRGSRYMNTKHELRRHLVIQGAVQGVGFRPFIFRLAHELQLSGWIVNSPSGVEMEVQGCTSDVHRFTEQIPAQLPALALIRSMQVKELLPLEGSDREKEFVIRPSKQEGGISALLLPDMGTCKDCLDDMFTNHNRRYHYPFTNCTNCGPRYSIIEKLPYDRPYTSMKHFPMCADCTDEYENPLDRRFHAQPNACPVCGPQMALWDRDGNELAIEKHAIDQSIQRLKEGRIIAIKGIGGFQLMADASNSKAIEVLRKRKGRMSKPFAMMAANSLSIDKIIQLTKLERHWLETPQAPIVLIEKKSDEPKCIAPEVSGQTPTLGFMLPYSPLHQLLLAGWDRPLVMTSGNLSEEPQCIDNQDAGRRLHDLADFYLLHDREICNRVDDSVVRMMDGAPRFLRRARGYAPAPILFPEGFQQVDSILALGGELKNTLCLLKEGQAVVSQHLGDLQEARTAGEYQRTISLYRELYQQQPKILVVDSHPDYRSTRLGSDWAQREGLELLTVQHHFAHIASVMADNEWPLDGGSVLGIALDGLGYGEDGTLWGGEFLRVDYHGFERLGFLKPVPMPGGVKAILEPWRNTYAQIASHIGWDLFQSAYPDLELTAYLADRPLEILETMLSKGLNSPLTSSCGRLFDAVAGALGLSRDRVSYEGQAAIELEALAVQALNDSGMGYPFEMIVEDRSVVMDPTPMWVALFTDLTQGVDREVIAARFHIGLAQAVAGLARVLTRKQGLDGVALSGGVFQNRTLLEALSRLLRSDGLQVLMHRQVPANDGGLSLGQAAIAAAHILENGE